MLRNILSTLVWTTMANSLNCDELERVYGRLLYPDDDPGERLEYTGDLCQGLPWGNGTMTWSYGATYQGEWVEGKRSGSGRYTYLSGPQDPEIDGDAAFLMTAPVMHDLDSFDRRVYEISESSDQEAITDESRMERIHTRLFRIKPSEKSSEDAGALTAVEMSSKIVEDLEDVYIGTWHNDEMDGFGVYKWSKSNPVNGEFVGELMAGKRWGKGKEVWKNGQVFEGNFVNGLKNGYGNLKFSTKSVYDLYIGQFKDGAFHGVGVLTWKNGNEYVGQFRNGTMHGYGQMVWIGNEGSNEVRYKGFWSKGYIRGRGSLEFVGKTSFVGLFDENEDGTLWLRLYQNNPKLNVMSQQIF